MINTIRKGALVRYVGNDERLKELWKDGTYRVQHKDGDSAVGYFPSYVCGHKHLQWGQIKLTDLELVRR